MERPKTVEEAVEVLEKLYGRSYAVQVRAVAEAYRDLMGAANTATGVLTQPKSVVGQPGRPESPVIACPYWADGEHCYSGNWTYTAETGPVAWSKNCACGATVERRP